MPTLPDETTVPADLDDVARAVVAGSGRARSELESLVRIPSVSAADPDACRRSAERTAEILRDAGLTDVRLLEVEGAHPYVYGSRLDAGADAPTVLLYAHHDVQPTGNAAKVGDPTSSSPSTKTVTPSPSSARWSPSTRSAPTWAMTPALSSAAPRPYRRPSRSVGTNGAERQSASSPGGWTSWWA